MCPEWNYQRFSDVFFAPFGLTVHFAHPLSTVVATAMLMDAGPVIALGVAKLACQKR
jgi:hypothetical protein